MKYLAIKNRGVCPIEGFTVLGVSTARGNADSIGQFGSGSKHSVLTCLRMGIDPIIFLGRTKICFSSEPASLSGGKCYNQVYVKVGTKAPRPMDIALEYGALDWNGVEMALREFVSNALDAVGGDASQVEFKIVEKIHSDDDSTIVAVPLTREVQQFYNELSNRFLHFKRDKDILQKKIVVKEKPGPAKIYRKGVFVRELEGNVSLFDYNFGEELKIDEARNLDDYSVVRAAIQAIAEPADMGVVLKSIARGEETWENTFGSHYYLKAMMEYQSDMKEKWQTAWKRTFGDKSVIASNMLPPGVCQSAREKGFNPIGVENTGWFDALSKAGVPTIFDVLDDINDKGHKITPVTPECEKMANYVWEWLVTLGLNKNKPQPPIKMFQSVMSGSADTCGYFKSGVVYISVNNPTNLQTILEEYAHYITGSADMTRDFQDYAFRVAGAMMEMAK